MWQELLDRDMTPYLEPKGAIWKQLLSQQEIPLYQQLAARIHIPATWDQFWSIGEVDVMEKESHNPHTIVCCNIDLT